MKEAAGEANMTVITIILIGLVAAAGAVLIPNLLKSTNKQSCCAYAGGTWENNACYATAANGSKTLVAEGNYYDSTNKSCK